MAVYYSNELQGIDSSPAVKANASAGYNAPLRVYRATVPMIAGAYQTTDTLTLAKIPSGSIFAFGIINASATMGASATLAIGNASSTGKYRAAATFTTANTPTLFGLSASNAAASTAEEVVIVTIAVAALPTSGTLNIDLYFIAP